MLKKTPLRGTDKVSVTFELRPESPVESVHLAGDFNDWDPSGHPMKQRKDGVWAITLRLPAAREYAFRYVLDERQWVTDFEADGLAPNGHGEANAVLVLN
jgi:1,4-alpha-glucan branching enzyme